MLPLLVLSSYAYFVTDISFLPTKQCIRKQINCIIHVLRPILNSLSHTACSSGNIIDFGARDPSPAPVPTEQSENLFASNFSCATQGQEYFTEL